VKTQTIKKHTIIPLLIFLIPSLIMIMVGCSPVVQKREDARTPVFVRPPEDVKAPEIDTLPQEETQPQVEVYPPVEIHPPVEVQIQEDTEYVAVLIENLESDNFDVQRRAVWALGETRDPRVIEPLMLAFKSENRSIQLNAIDAVSRMGAMAVDPLIEGIKGDDRDIRQGSSKSMRKIKDPEASELLIFALYDDNPYVRLNAAKALGNIEDPDSVDSLIESLQDGNVYVRKNAAWALGKIGDKSAIEPLTMTLMDRSADVRLSTVWALRKIGDVLVIDPLITALDDSDEEVRNSSVEALEEITGKEFGQDIAGWKEWWEENKVFMIVEDPEN
jgi:HEAT repeat protein